MPSPRRRPAPVPAQRQNRLWNIRNAANAVPIIELFGDIGVSREGDPWWGMEGGAGTFLEFANELKAIGNVPELRIEIHSYGGDVVVGKGIYDKLMEHPANKIAVIYGICASAATYPALACQKIVMSANSFFIIHNSTGICFGNAIDMQRTGRDLETIDQSIANLYVARTGMALDDIRQIMDQDTWMTGTEAQAIGLVDEIIDPIAIAPEQQAAPSNFLPRVLNTMPAAARPWFDSRSLPSPANTAPTLMSQPATPPAAAPATAPVAPVSPAPANTAPQVTPTVAPAAEPAPANVAPAPAAPVVAPALAPVAAPANAVPAAQPDLASLVTNAVTTALAPLNQRLQTLEDQQRAGITPANLGGAQPAPVAGSNTDGSKPANNAATPRASIVAAFSNMAVFQKK